MVQRSKRQLLSLSGHTLADTYAVLPRLLGDARVRGTY